MGGLGGTEILVLAVLFLVIFGPSKLPQMAKDVGKFIGNARRTIDEFKDELTADADPEPKKSVKRSSSPSRNGVSGEKSGVSVAAADETDDGLRDL